MLQYSHPSRGLGRIRQPPAMFPFVVLDAPTVVGLLLAGFVADSFGPMNSDKLADGHNYIVEPHPASGIMLVTTMYGETVRPSAHPVCGILADDARKLI